MSRKMNRILSMILMITMLTGMIPESLVYAHDDEETVVIAEDAETTEEVSENSVSEDGAPQEDEQESGQTASSNEAEEAVSDNAVSGNAAVDDAVSDNVVSTNTADAESYPEFTPDPVVIDGMRISVYAAAGAFPEGVTLSVSKVSRKELRKVEETLEGERGENEKAALSYTYDIKILDMVEGVKGE